MKILRRREIAFLVSCLALAGCGYGGLGGLSWSPSSGYGSWNGRFMSPGAPAGTLQIVNAGDGFYVALEAQDGSGAPRVEIRGNEDPILPGEQRAVPFGAGFYPEVLLYEIGGGVRRFSDVAVVAGETVTLTIED